MWIRKGSRPQTQPSSNELFGSQLTATNSLVLMTRHIRKKGDKTKIKFLFQWPHHTWVWNTACPVPYDYNHFAFIQQCWLPFFWREKVGFSYSLWQFKERARSTPQSFRSDLGLDQTLWPCPNLCLFIIYKSCIKNMLFSVGINTNKFIGNREAIRHTDVILWILQLSVWMHSIYTFIKIHFMPSRLIYG